ncbi:mammalian cell entry protein, partial [Mycobacterium avium]
NLAPAGPVPPPSTFAPGLPPGPPAPPGPGNQLPAPFINPGGTGGSGAAGGGSQN